MKIDKIQINNFRAFYGENIFSIEGKNCLIYGENGSGKSSFYMALKMFVESSAKDTVSNFAYSDIEIMRKYIDKNYRKNWKSTALFSKNIFSFVNVDREKLNSLYNEIMLFDEHWDKLEKMDNDEIYNVFVEEGFMENLITRERHTIDEEMEDEDKRQSAVDIKLDIVEMYNNKFRDIYKELMTLVTSVDESEKHFIKIMFSDGNNFTVGDNGRSDIEGNKKLNNCYKIKPFLHYKKLMKMYYFDKVKEDLNLFFAFKELLKNYYIQAEGKTLAELEKVKQYKYLNQILNQELLTEINTILNKFHTDINIEKFVFKYQMTLFKEQNYNSIYIKAKYNGAEIDNFHLFFNEARLSALSMSIYFASILKMYEIAGNDVLKILVLDDILVGLDMGNRLSLIKILNEEFKEFQIFMLTYDKTWYETFKTYRENETNWKDFELYKQNIEIDDRKFEVPVIFDRTNNDSYFDRAKNMFTNFDYPSCANYLRKETEKVLIHNLGIKNLEGIIELSELKKKYNLLFDELKNFNINNILQDFEKDLGTPNAKTGKLYGKINSLNQLNGKIKEILSENNFLKLNQIKDTILNPLSHHDIETPIYKEELEKAIEIVENLKKE